MSDFRSGLRAEYFGNYKFSQLEPVAEEPSALLPGDAPALSGGASNIIKNIPSR